MTNDLTITQEWDKVFPKSEKINHRKVTFHNRYGITLVADLYEPKNVEGKLPAIAVCGPFGAIKQLLKNLFQPSFVHITPMIVPLLLRMDHRQRLQEEIL